MSNSLITNLKKIASDDEVTLNALTVKILTDFIEWDHNAVKAGWMIFPKLAQRVLVDKCSEKTLSRLAKQIADYSKDMRLFMTGADDLASFITVLRSSARKSGFNISFNTFNGGTKIILQHYMGANWSVLHKVIYERMLNDLGLHYDITHTANTLVIAIK